MKIKAIGFDLDGTLYPDSALRIRALPLVLSHPRLSVAFSQVRRQIRREVASSRMPPCQTGDEFRRMQAERLGKRLKCSALEADRLLGRVFYGALFEYFSGIQPFEGVPDCLNMLKTTGYSLGLLSDLPPLRKLELLGLDSWFDSIQCSEDAGALKPHPKSLLKLAASLRVQPQQMLYVGNNPYCDYQGAKAAGMLCAIRSRRPISHADHVFTDWNDLYRYVEMLNS